MGDKKFAYDIWGDAVNTASQDGEQWGAGMVNISWDTYQILKSLSDDSHPSPFGRGNGGEVMEGLNFTCRGKIPAKNKEEIGMYSVNRKQSTPLLAKKN